jgi:DNA-binding NtrC family response regulator
MQLARGAPRGGGRADGRAARRMNPRRYRRAMILIADDKADVRLALELLLSSEGYACAHAASPADALAQVERGGVALLLCDMNFALGLSSGREGLGLIDAARARAPQLPIVAMTAFGSIELAVEAIKRGAVDFLEKPFDNARCLQVIATQLALRRTATVSTGDGPRLIAESAAMAPVLKLIERAAPSAANVLILGENGTGKSLLAQVLHARSPRAARPLVKVNLGGVAASVFDSELFGHVRGAYTDARSDRVGRFELADGGTLFLDEIGNLAPELQPKLLRVLEDGEFERLGSSKSQRVDVRLISATNANLDALIEAGTFREDLKFRLNTIEITLPSLRERLEDLPALAAAALAQAAQRHGKGALRFGADALRALAAYPWPGNVRELGHVCERAALMADSTLIGAADLGLNPSLVRAVSSLREREIVALKRALEVAGGNIQRAAAALGLSRAALYRRLDKFGLRGAE